MIDRQETISFLENCQEAADPNASWKGKLICDTLATIIEYLKNDAPDAERKFDDPGAMIRIIMEEKKITVTQLAKDLGMSRQSLHQYISRNPEGMKFNVMNEIMEKLGYEIVVVEKPE
jgi:DNA-binding Xre family transcriptional regulator|uniref:Cro/C1-type HTH DNA-binding domain protein n=1 Tax=Myoviridae sp. ct5xZ3 TaxID=2827601 RepID=A0A8S5RRV5_9CAUD|nr:MAG TPA: Cro/C1-type HTH DNA-binding domain protein [Myoviridae sp. ct5xZ3]